MTAISLSIERDLSDQDPKILVEQIKALYRALLPVLATSLLASAILLYGLWDVVSHTLLSTWMGLMLILALVRGTIYFRYRFHFKSELAYLYARYFILSSGIGGLLWGFGAVVLFPEQGLEYQLFILCLLVGMGAGSVSALATYLPAFFAYFPISLLPSSIMLISLGDPIPLSLGIMTIIMVAAFCYFSININHVLTQSLKNRFENIDLVGQLHEQKDEADQANIAKSKFLAAASHDLRQPLHALTLFTSVLDETIRAPKERRVVDQIKASVQSLQNLFNALLDISRLDAGVMQVEKTDFLVQPLLAQLANDFDPQANEKGLRIFWPTCPYTVHSDQTQFEQILRNYISNAIRYTDNGEIRVTCDNRDEKITINIIDTGLGIPLEEQQAIFTEFHQLSNPERDRSKGLGLGLAIVQRTARLLGHTIGLASQPGKGSTFSITVEQATRIAGVVESMSENANVSTLEVDDASSQADKALIVVIDNEVGIREGTQDLLQLWDCDVIAAANKEEALLNLRTELGAQERTPDGIIADYRLSENLTGIEVIHAIHDEYHNNIPALIVTGDIAVEDLKEVNSSGFQVLHKPVAPVKLRTFLRHIQLQKTKLFENR